VLTESIAKKYLDYRGRGDTTPIGKLLDFGNGTNAIEVTEIIQDPPHNTHMKLGMILPLDSWQSVAKDDCWACSGQATLLGFRFNNS
jgi:putative ABC transport system permease protein